MHAKGIKVQNCFETIFSPLPHFVFLVVHLIIQWGKIYMHVSGFYYLLLSFR